MILHKMPRCVLRGGFFSLVLPLITGSRSTTDSIGVSEALDPGSIPGATTQKPSSALLEGFFIVGWQHRWQITRTH